VTLSVGTTVIDEFGVTTACSVMDCPALMLADPRVRLRLVLVEAGKL
jgi:hypothetical protein